MARDRQRRRAPVPAGPAANAERVRHVAASGSETPTDLSLAELCERVQAVWNLTVSQSMVCRELQLLNLPVKKSRSMIVHVRRLA